MAYYTLVEQNDDNGHYYIQFGDYTRKAVQAELDYMWWRYATKTPRSMRMRKPDKYRILKTDTSDQHLIDAALMHLHTHWESAK